jgi:DedD protein
MSDLNSDHTPEQKSDHNLTDLMLDTNTPTNNKAKGFLTIVALLIVIAIVAIILNKTMNTTPDNSDLMFEDNSSVVFAPELKLQDPKENIDVQEEISSPEVIDDLEETIDEEEEVVTEPIEEITTSIDEEETKEVVAPTVPTINTPKKAVHKPTVKETTQKPKPVVKKTTPKKQTYVQKHKYYVQVGSFKDQPSPRFLKIIKKRGYHYFITKPNYKGDKKLLIGPYKSRAEVDKARTGIRRYINKSAFVVTK